MEKARHGGNSSSSNRHSGTRRKKSTKSNKKRKSQSHEENGTSSSPDNDGTVVTGHKPLVEYSDVSSEDLSGPEAGEIQSGEESVFGFSGDEGEQQQQQQQLAMNRSRRYRGLLEEEYYLAARNHLMMRSPTRRSVQQHPELLSPTQQQQQQRERQPSASSRSSPSSEVRTRRKLDSSPLGDYRQVESSPYDEIEMERRKRKRKEKKHKRDKKSKKKKKKKSRSTSVDDSSDSVPSITPAAVLGHHHHQQQEQEALSDWEAPVAVTAAGGGSSVEKIDTSACSPVSNDSHIASPEPEELDEIGGRHRTPPASPIRLLRDEPPRESPHTPPLLPSRSYSSSSHTIIVRERTLSPIIIPHERERSSRLG